MSLLKITQGLFRLSDTRMLRLDELTLEKNQCWAFVGANGVVNLHWRGHYPANCRY